jgi:hypothetical protein
MEAGRAVEQCAVADFSRSDRKDCKIETKMFRFVLNSSIDMDFSSVNTISQSECV